MKIAIISLTTSGTKLSAEISRNLDKDHFCERFSFFKYSDSDTINFSDLRSLISDIFNKYDALVFISACGIAVRMIAPHIVSKMTDPAVIAVDEQGKFSVSLLSGHIGRANALAGKIAEIIGAEPVITTATDIDGRFSPDLFAAANGLHICEPAVAKIVAAAVVNGEKIGFFSTFPFVNLPSKFFNQECAKTGVCVDVDTQRTPFETTLHLVPKNIVIGVGCRKNIFPEVFENFILNILEAHQIPLFRVCGLHTIRIKEHERAINEFCRKYNIPMKLYTAEELMKVEGRFAHSDFVMKTTGADNICERSAAIDADRLIIKKTALDGITFAAAEKYLNIDFERRIL